MHRRSSCSNSYSPATRRVHQHWLKAAQHEHGCVVALLRANSLKLEEKLSEKYNYLPEEISVEKPRGEPDEVAADPSHPSSKKSCNARKRTSRSHSLEPTTATPGGLGNEMDGGSRRKSLRRSNDTKTELCEPSEELFEIKDLKLPICSQEDYSSNHPTPSVEMETVCYSERKGQSVSPEHQSQETRRSFMGRPMRRAAAKVSSYKEVPINVKMRRER